MTTDESQPPTPPVTDFTRGTQGTVTTLNGETIAIPDKLTWGQELKAFKAIGNLIKNIPSLSEIDWAARAQKTTKGQDIIEVNDLLKVLPDLLLQGEYLTTFAAAVLKKEEQWVQDQLDVKEVLKVVGPFFTQCLAKMADSMASTASPQ